MNPFRRPLSRFLPKLTWSCPPGGAKTAMDSFLMIAGFLTLSLLLAVTGLWMLASPRRFAAVSEAFAAAGNLPSFLVRSVKGALFQIRVLGLGSFVLGTVLMGGTLSFASALAHATQSGPKLYWLIVPAALGLSASYLILFYASEWVARTFQKWVDHPLVPQELILAFTWELRIAGVAFAFLGLGAMSIWLKSLLR